MYHILSISLFVVLALIWTKKDWGNFAIKIIFVVMALYGAYDAGIVVQL